MCSKLQTIINQTDTPCISVSSHDGITGNRLTIQKKKTLLKWNKIHEETFQIVDFWSQSKTVISEQKQTHKVSPMIAHLSDQGYFPEHDTENWSQVE